ncbi:hypothetical protein [Oryzobacter telluris]|uniref:hypothetical protein n=1 Tax=Oryzobacter telluris TaxID=3149179 RepID=UPI00370DDA36
MTPTPRTVTVVAVSAAAGPHGPHGPLGPLLDRWRRGPGLRLVPWELYGSHGPGPADLARLAAGSGALLLVGPRNRAPRTVLAGPVVLAPGGRPVPAAWLPATSTRDLARFARTAVAVHTRADAGGFADDDTPSAAPTRTLAVLGERQPRFDRLAERVTVIGTEAEAAGGLRTLRCTAYELSRDDTVDLLGRGPALAVYVGHGRPVGWVGYAGMRAHHLADAAARPGHEPVAALLSLTCRTASRRRTGLSFAESLPLAGVAAATLGAVVPTHHTANARWAVRIARDAGSARTVGDLVAAITPHDPHASDYRLLGDPTAPLLDAPAFDTVTPRRLEEAS